MKHILLCLMLFCAVMGNTQNCDKPSPPNTNDIRPATIDWVWQNRILVNDNGDPAAFAFKNYGFDQIIANGGYLNYLVRWESDEPVTAAQRDQIAVMIEHQINKWCQVWLTGYDCWPYDRIRVNVVAWAVKDRATLQWNDADWDGKVYVGIYESYDTQRNEPTGPRECNRFYNQNGRYPNCQNEHFDMSLWCTKGFQGGAGGDWGQRLSSTYILQNLYSENVHILLHEIGHSFSLPDFYESFQFPPASTGGLPPAIMQAGAASVITPWDGWMFRRVWSELKQRTDRGWVLTPPEDCHGVSGGGAVVDACGKCIGGTTGQVSDDADGDGVIDCEDECPADPLKTAKGICGCGVQESTCITTNELSYSVVMPAMTEYTPVSVPIGDITEALGMTAQQIASSFGSSILYYGVNPDGALNATSTANAPGHWYNQSGQTIAWGENAYVYSELNINTLLVNIGQYPGRSQSGNQYTIKQALVHTREDAVTKVILIFTIRVAEADCNGDPGGTAAVDACNQCAGGNTGIVPVTDPQRCVVTALSGFRDYAIQVYPNPANTEVYISEETDWILSDVTGMELMRGHETVLSLSGFSPGIYLLRIDNRIVKIIKN